MMIFTLATVAAVDLATLTTTTTTTTTRYLQVFYSANYGLNLDERISQSLYDLRLV
jgi:hypothetical protein